MSFLCAYACPCYACKDLYISSFFIVPESLSLDINFINFFRLFKKIVDGSPLTFQLFLGLLPPGFFFTITDISGWMDASLVCGNG